MAFLSLGLSFIIGSYMFPALFARFTHAAPSLTRSSILPRQAAEAAAAAAAAAPEKSSGQLLLLQMRNPAEVLSVLLIIGGDVVQKAIAQFVGQPIFSIDWTDIPTGKNKKLGDCTLWGWNWKKIPKTQIVPVAFSFGWVAFSFNATLAVLGDGILTPKPEDTIYVIDLDSGSRKQNESWVLYRLFRDLEMMPSRLDEARPVPGQPCIRYFYTSPLRDKRPKPERDLVWYLFLLILPAQFVLAAAPYWLHGNWTIILITSIGTSLAAITAALPQWEKEKYDARSNKRSYILTRGNGHDNDFVLFHRGDENRHLGLEDLAVVRPNPEVVSTLTKFAMPALSACWIMLLVAVGGLERDTWYLFGIGALGMLQNLVAAGIARRPEAHGLPLTEFSVKIQNRRKRAKMLPEVEDKAPGVGIRLFDVYFPPPMPNPGELKMWKEYQDSLENRIHIRKELITQALNEQARKVEANSAMSKSTGETKEASDQVETIISVQSLPTPTPDDKITPAGQSPVRPGMQHLENSPISKDVV